MKALERLELVVEMYLTASYSGFGRPATTGNEVPGVPSVQSTGEAQQIEVKDYRVYRVMDDLERDIEKLVSKYFKRLIKLAERTFSRTCETCGDRFVGGETEKYCYRCISERLTKGVE